MPLRSYFLASNIYSSFSPPSLYPLSRFEVERVKGSGERIEVEEGNIQMLIFPNFSSNLHSPEIYVSNSGQGFFFHRSIPDGVQEQYSSRSVDPLF